jgi:DNA-binding transcriptional MerR regulator
LKTAQGDGASLTIGELAEATGVSAGTLRMWESRHGFPTAQRLPSGHRRYAAEQVARVLDVVRRRELGSRLDVAIRQVTADSGGPAPRSVYAELTRRHPEQPRQRLRKETLLALSWAIEDEVGAAGAHGHLFGAFQTGHRYAAARARWTELARTARSSYAFADFGGEAGDQVGGGPAPGPTLVHLAPGSPMRREWSVVHDSPELAVVLTAWELPGQTGVPDRHRLFESLWTLDPAAVRTAARCCALVAADAGDADAGGLGAELAAPPVAERADAGATTRLAHRALGYVDGALAGGTVAR